MGHRICGLAGIALGLLLGAGVAYAQDLTSAEAATDYGVITTALLGGGSGVWVVRQVLMTVERIAFHGIDRVVEALDKVANPNVTVNHVYHGKPLESDDAEA